MSVDLLQNGSWEVVLGAFTKDARSSADRKSSSSLSWRKYIHRTKFLQEKK
jgi:hypothetical protein